VRHRQWLKRVSGRDTLVAVRLTSNYLARLGDRGRLWSERRSNRRLRQFRGSPQGMAQKVDRPIGRKRGRSQPPTRGGLARGLGTQAGTLRSPKPSRPAVWRWHKSSCSPVASDSASRSPFSATGLSTEGHGRPEPD